MSSSSFSSCKKKQQPLTIPEQDHHHEETISNIEEDDILDFEHNEDHSFSHTDRLLYDILEIEKEISLKKQYRTIHASSYHDSQSKTCPSDQEDLPMINLDHQDPSFRIMNIPSPAADPLKDTLSIQDRLMGSIWGHAYGDVVGCPIEGWKSGEIRKFYGNKDLQMFDFSQILTKGFPSKELMASKDFKPLEKKRQILSKKERKESATEVFLRHIRPIGIHSDDTQQAGFTEGDCFKSTRSCHEKSNVTPIRIELAKNVRAFSQFGSNTSKALKKLSQKNCCAYNSGSSTFGIGGMMRCSIAPICFALKDYLIQMDILGESKKFFEPLNLEDEPSKKMQRKSKHASTCSLEHNLGDDDDPILKAISYFSYSQCLTTHSTIESATVTFASNVIAYKFIECGNREETIDWLLDHLEF
ncbi:hypothetical protein FDP41_006690 [Naegleria fowleri]|uniref:ADP-ribosylglycohydrolase n=1 Tax=Naegleria fowleri TaxID=5763 RepID=A0A6A5BJ95_NAEFO|nr:uncharacterized protein FDP41_006690 [Naegleria fowleri]KAF0974080.1 hypothetical protein FDP41_006690 [Naegleria fowleri]